MRYYLAYLHNHTYIKNSGTGVPHYDKMKSTKFIILSVLFLSFTLLPSVWKEFQSYEGKFKILIPSGAMTEKVNKMKTAVGELDYHQFIYKPEDKDPENVFYLVNYCDYPKGTFPQDSTDLINEFLQATVDASAESVSGKVTYQADIQQSTHKGKVWRVQYNKDNAQVKNKCFIANDRFYLLQVMTLKLHSLNPSVDKFLNSFQIF